MGRHDEAIAEAEKARELDPLSSIINAWVGSRYFFAHQYSKAMDLYRGAVEMDLSFAPVHSVLGQGYEQTGMLRQAIAELETAVRLSGGSAFYVASLATLTASQAGAVRRRNCSAISDGYPKEIRIFV